MLSSLKSEDKFEQLKHGGFLEARQEVLFWLLNGFVHKQCRWKTSWIHQFQRITLSFAGRIF